MYGPDFSRSLIGARRQFIGLLGLFAAAVCLSSPFENASAAEGINTAALGRSDRVSSLGLPKVLSSGDARHYREIFALQERGKWKAADKLIAKLEDDRLMGHVLEQRFMHPTDYRARYKELKGWLAKYADHPEARRIYKLAVKRRPQNYKYPNKPRLSAFIPPPLNIEKTEVYESTKRLSRSKRRRVAQIKRQIRRNVYRTRLSVSEDLLKTAEVKRLFDQAEIDQSYGKIAAAWFYYGKIERAYELAGPAAKRSGGKAPLANWIAGLAAWRLGYLEEAAEHFVVMTRSQYLSSWNKAAGAYWAARANLRLRNPERMSDLLNLAAEHPRTFYGLLARRALGMTIEFEFHRHKLTPELIAHLEARPAGRRALALLQIGQRTRAQKELYYFGKWKDPQTMEALLALADTARIPALAFKLGHRVAATEDDHQRQGRLDAALYPIPPWRPKDGFKVDRALLYALMRQESSFNPEARSPDGARGLMQLMPRTASFISPGKRYRGRTRNLLYDPGLNMQLGQRYVSYLLTHDRVQGDLFRLATAYNGGPGNLNKWQRRIQAKDDPLIFIESLPSRETRLFIERVLTNLWIYRKRLGQPAPSLQSLAAGEWPSYKTLDHPRPEVAFNVAH